MNIHNNQKYKSKTDNLLRAVIEVINSSLSEAEKSRELMALLRKDFILVKNNVLDTSCSSSNRTLDPYSADVKIELEDGEREGTASTEYTKIYGYSFGPWNTNKQDDYFKDDTLRILWLLKEPSLKDINQMRGREEGIDQTSKKDGFPTWKEIREESNNTTCGGAKRNLITDTHKLLALLAEMDSSELEQIKDEKLKAQIKRLKEEKLNNAKGSEGYTEDEEVKNKVMNHICILEVNHFPGLAFNSNDIKEEYVTLWGIVNIPLIKLLIHFYQPAIVICGGTLQKFHKSFHEVDSYADHIIANINDSKQSKDGKNIGKKWEGKVLSEFGYEPDKKYATAQYIEGTSDYIIPTIEGPIFIQTDSPCAPKRHFNPPRLAKLIAEIIKDK